MSKKNISEEAAKIQGIAEGFHSASAILAVESILSQAYKERLLSDNATADYRKKLAEASLSGDTDRIALLMEERKRARANLPTSMPRIVVTYEDIPEKSARYTSDGKVITIILPKVHQDRIISGIINNLDQWTEDMKASKNSLRRLTLHELGHALPSTEFSEIQLNELADALFDIREKRNNGVYK